MRAKASTVGNIVGKNVPVSLTEVSCELTLGNVKFLRLFSQDDNLTIRTWHPDGPNAQVEQKTNIMPHHEVLLRLDAMDLERGLHNSLIIYRSRPFQVSCALSSS